MVTSLLFPPACLIVRFSGRRKTPKKGVEVKRRSEGARPLLPASYNAQSLMPG